MTVLLNDQALGSFNPALTSVFDCHSCQTQVFSRTWSDPKGMPGYQYRGKNSLKLQTDKTNCVASATITLTAARPLLQYSASSLPFGAVSLGTSSTQTVTLTNTGDTRLVIEKPSVPPPFTLAVVADPLVINTGSSVNLSVTFTPKEESYASGMLSFQSSDPDLPHVGISLQGTGGLARLSVNPTALDFGAVRVGTTSSKSVFLKNSGSLPIVLSSVSTRSPFSVDGVPPEGLILKPNEVHSLTVSFTASAGVSTEALHVQSTPFAEIALRGKGIESSIAMATSSMDFGIHSVEGQSIIKSLTVFNQGQADLFIQSVSVKPPFTVKTAPTLTIKAQGKAELQLAYSPQEGQANDKLILKSDDLRTPELQIDLTATGVKGEALEITMPDGGLDFGKQDVHAPSPPRILTLKNTGPATLVVEPIQAPTGYSVTPADRRALAPGTAVPLQVTFEPTSIGQFTHDLTITTDGPGGGAQSQPLNGQGAEADLKAYPAALSWLDAGVEVGDTSSPLTLTLANEGEEGLTINTVAVEGPFSLQAPSFPKTLGPNSALPLTVTFKPAARGNASGLLRVFLATHKPPMVVKLHGTGFQAAPRISHAILDFGGQRLSTTSAPLEMTLFNTGTANLLVTAVNVTGPFSVSELTPGVQIVPGGKHPIRATYKPVEAGAESGMLEIQGGLPGPVQVVLRGAGTTASLESSVTAVSFGSQDMGTTQHRAVELLNTGTSPVTVSRLDRSEGFSISGLPLPHELTPGERHHFHVSFTPARAGDHSGSLALFHDASPSPLTIAVQGTGVAEAMTVTPGSIAFGNQRVNTSSESIPLEITNTGSAPVTVAVESSDTAFQVDTRGVAAPMPAGGRATVEVAFRPTQSGPVRGELRVVPSGNGLAPTVVLVEGSGEAITVEGSGCSAGGPGGVWMLAAWTLAMRMTRGRRGAGIRGAAQLLERRRGGGGRARVRPESVATRRDGPPSDLSMFHWSR
ncbi:MULTISPECIES: choice-of-anchor D domain-containing protein [unclassified Corallococcus]|uniref:choice-of-anchor D domain-containing protein n=1 Tax=unclassified Corallococcus TaxID=2685029 RepID=UPI001A8EDEF4|nr:MULTISPECIES: choice-of-anchor D domain-containing protein [unclassified Corallococcus]MBN9684337.1 choice-of-anchor D domain-containing protein [Corallococcus sp. NCSPR001]WAS84184.1 choice-of-anchor D domain-containing protein [Corallococcus sp. NCRR]